MSGPTSWDGLPGDGPWEREVPVLVRSGEQGRDDKVQPLQLRLALQPGKQLHSGRVLRLQVTSETDAFFLHTLELCEDDFAALKAEQSILVDFPTFPTKLVELFALCTAAAAAAGSPRWQAVLRSPGPGGVDSLLTVVETNHFKQLTHVSLRLRPGHDAAVKQHLAGRVWDLKAEVAGLRERLEDARRELARTQEASASAAASFAAERATAAAALQDVKSAALAASCDARQAAADELAAAMAAAERERAAMRDSHSRALEVVEARAGEAASALRVMEAAKLGAEQRLREAGERITVLETDLGVAHAEAAACRERAAASAAAVLAATAGAQAAQARADAAQGAVTSGEATVSTLRERLAAGDAARCAAETAAAEARAAAAAAESRLGEACEELRAANAAIDRLQADATSARQKAKMRGAVCSRQETALAEKEAAVEAACREAQQLREAVALLTADRDAARAQLEDHRRQLADSSALLAANQQMISWLNAQVKESQGLGGQPQARLSSSNGPHMPPRGSVSTIQLPPAVTALRAKAAGDAMCGSASRPSTPPGPHRMPLAPVSVNSAGSSTSLGAGVSTSSLAASVEAAAKGLATAAAAAAPRDAARYGVLVHR